MNQLKKVLFASLGVVALLLSGSSSPTERARAVGVQEPAPAAELRWTPHRNGFAGVYKSGRQVFSVESYHPTPDFTLTRVLKPGGVALIEVLRNGPTVTLTLAEAKVSFDISGAAPPDFTEEEQAELRAALGSVDALVARRVVAATTSQLKRQGVERRLLAGLGVASMVLGSEPKEVGAKAGTSELLGVVIPEECAADDCLGCCGSGCIGCIGCCTEACRRHDQCVRQRGQLRCLFLLPAAIASVFLECF